LESDVLEQMEGYKEGGKPTASFRETPIKGKKKATEVAFS